VPVTGSGDGRDLDLPRRLRAATSDAHRSVEDAVDLPASVRTLEDYVRLLGRFWQLHAPLEERLEASAWAPRWTDLGIELSRHRRSHLVADDLAVLDAAPPSRPVRLPALRTFGEALGCLYVLEGSSLGGSVLAPALRDAVGDVPLRFFSGEGRGHPAPWQAVRHALRRFDARDEPRDEPRDKPRDEPQDQVVLGALETFAAFGRHLGGVARAGGPAA
jgi:heme oxygenase